MWRFVLSLLFSCGLTLFPCFPSLAPFLFSTPPPPPHSSGNWLLNLVTRQMSSGCRAWQRRSGLSPRRGRQTAPSGAPYFYFHFSTLIVLQFRGMCGEAGGVERTSFKTQHVGTRQWWSGPTSTDAAVLLDCHLQNSPNVCCPSAAADRVGTEQEGTIAAHQIATSWNNAQGAEGLSYRLIYSFSHLLKHLLSICCGLCIALDIREARVGKSQRQVFAGFAFCFGRSVNRSYAGCKHSAQYYVEI